jgi:hypothetical protein
VLESIPEEEKTYGHQCIELLQKYFPHETQQEAYRLLFERTAYPFREIEFIEENLRYIKEHGEAAQAKRIYDSMDREMERAQIARRRETAATKGINVELNLVE